MKQREWEEKDRKGEVADEKNGHDIITDISIFYASKCSFNI